MSNTPQGKVFIISSHLVLMQFCARFIFDKSDSFSFYNPSQIRGVMMYLRISRFNYCLKETTDPFHFLLLRIWRVQIYRKWRKKILEGKRIRQNQGTIQKTSALVIRNLKVKLFAVFFYFHWFDLSDLLKLLI